MELKYRGNAKLQQGKRTTEIDVYSNDLSLTETEKRLFGIQMGEIIAKYYQNPENQKEFEEWQKQQENKELTDEKIMEVGKVLKSKLSNTLDNF